MLRIGFICPTYRAVEFDNYTRLSLSSFFSTTPNGVAIVVDDASDSWSKDYEKSLKEVAPSGCLHCIPFKSQGGLTRSWNAGLSRAEELKLDYAIAGNNDIIFTQQWYKGILHALENGYSLVGPLSNAPGNTAGVFQDIGFHLKDYKNTDDANVLNSYARDLAVKYPGHILEKRINGFFQVAKMSSWVKGKFDKNNFYRPVNKYTSSGRKNPTPLMTLNEDELQARWHRLGMYSAIALSSFIFHYRSVTRGSKYKKGRWYRQNV